MLRTIFILLIRLFRILFFLLLCLINSFFGTFEKTQLQIEHFLEHLAKWHCFFFLLEQRPSKEMTDEQLAKLAPWSELLQSIKTPTVELE